MLVSGGGAVWAIDDVRGQGWRLGEPGKLIGPVSMPGVDRAAADGDRVWWMSHRDTTLRDGTRDVDVGVKPAERGGITVCANAVWLSASRGLVLVGTWAAAMGPLVPVSAGPLSFLTCAGGVLVGGSSRYGLVVLDPSSDSGRPARGRRSRRRHGDARHDTDGGVGVFGAAFAGTARAHSRRLRRSSMWEGSDADKLRSGPAGENR